MGRLNLLYLYAHGHSNWDENEIRYSIRSMSTTNDVAWIGIAGPEVPPFLKDICHIKCEIPPKRKFANLLSQLLTAMNDERVPEDLILMNDDFFMRANPPWDWTPTFMGPAPVKPKNQWQKTVALTTEWAKVYTKEPMSYEGHTPMPIKKSLALQTLIESIPLVEQGKVLQFRTAYGNMHKIGGKLHVNAKHKTLKAWPADSPFLSTPGHPAQEVKDYITSAWPNKSRWEV